MILTKSLNMDQKFNNITLPSHDFSVPPPIISNPSENIVKNNEKSENVKVYSRKRSRSREKSRDSSRKPDSRDYRRSTSKSSSTYSKYDRDRDYRYGRATRERDNRDYTSNRRKRSRSRDRRSPPRSRESSRRSPHSSRSSSSRHSPQSRSKNHDQKSQKPKDKTERERLLEKWRKNYCETSEQITKKLQELADAEQLDSWIRSSPADIYYKRVKDNIVEATPRLDALCSLFDDELLKRAKNIREKKAPYVPQERRRRIRVCKHKCK